MQKLLAGRWATAPADRTPRVPGEPDVRLRCYLDVRQTPPAALRPPSTEPFVLDVLQQTVSDGRRSR
ncbi:DUF6207 family protein [Streptomyces massasporeus]|uniref:DUF6207 family protein n=1 Tax=Streptomyces massasporeus TaxID=67324 RepID=UPI0034016539